MPETTGSSAPATASEVLARLKAEWEEVIQASGVGLDDNFFDVGGTSMHIVDVHSQIVETFDLPQLPLIDLFEHTTLRSLAAHVWQTLTTHSQEPAPSAALPGRACAGG